VFQETTVGEQISTMMLHFTAEVNESIRVVQGRCSDAEFRSYRSACAKVLGELLLEMRS
jgi:hypothetical protein